MRPTSLARRLGTAALALTIGVGVSACGNDSGDTDSSSSSADEATGSTTDEGADDSADCAAHRTANGRSNRGARRAGRACAYTRSNWMRARSARDWITISVCLPNNFFLCTIFIHKYPSVIPPWNGSPSPYEPN